MAGTPISVRFGIVCDQVRREDNGKLLLIGTYRHHISVAIPTPLALTLVLGIWAKIPVQDHQLEIRATFNGEQIYRGNGAITVSEAGADLMVLPNIVVSIDKVGDLEFKAKFGSDRWKVVTSIPIRGRFSVDPNAS